MMISFACFQFVAISTFFPDEGDFKTFDLLEVSVSESGKYRLDPSSSSSSSS